MTSNTKWKLRHILLPGALAVGIMVSLGVTYWIDWRKDVAILQLTIALYTAIWFGRVYRSHGKFRQ